MSTFFPDGSTSISKLEYIFDVKLVVMVSLYGEDGVSVDMNWFDNGSVGRLGNSGDGVKW